MRLDSIVTHIYSIIRKFIAGPHNCKGFFLYTCISMNSTGVLEVVGLSRLIVEEYSELIRHVEEAAKL